MAFRVELAPHVVLQIASLPESARDALRWTLSFVIDDPYDPVVTDPTSEPDLRMAVFGGAGFVEFQPWDELKVVVVHRVVWAG